MNSPLYWALDHYRPRPCDWKSLGITYSVIGHRRYRLESPIWCETGIVGCAAQVSQGQRVVARLDQLGRLEVLPGFVCDGSSGPTVQTRETFQAAFFHDALYAMGRAGKLSECEREACDLVLYRVALWDGMYRWRAKLWLHAVRALGGFAYLSREPRPITLGLA